METQMSEAMTLRARSGRKIRGPVLTALVSAALVATSIGLPAVAQAALTDPVVVTVNGTDVAAAAKNVNGLTFKGFGLLSGNSTSSLLMDYKAQHPDKYWQLIQTLFGGSNPIMNTVKIEMGNDRNTSTGPEAATMRTRAEYPNVQREPGFQLAADAQKVAAGTVHVSLLRWSRPTWVATDADQYIWFKNTVLAAYREYGIMVDSINPTRTRPAPRTRRSTSRSRAGCATTPRGTRAQPPATRTTASRAPRRRSCSTASRPSRPTRWARRRCRSATR